MNLSIQDKRPIAIAALVKEAISSGIKLLIVLGIVEMTGEQLAILLLFTDNFMALAQAIYAQARSTPVADPTVVEGAVVKVKSTSTGKVLGATQV